MKPYENKIVCCGGSISSTACSCFGEPLIEPVDNIQSVIEDNILSLSDEIIFDYDFDTDTTPHNINELLDMAKNCETCFANLLNMIELPIDYSAELEDYLTKIN